MNGGADGVSYDTTSYPVTVTVTEEKIYGEPENPGEDPPQIGLILHAEVKYGNADSLTVTNTFEPAEAVPEVTKALTGREWTDDDSFTFTLAAVTEGAPLPDTVTGTATQAQPKVSFGTITFNKAGTYEYTITETSGSADGVAYDTAAHSVVITVTKDNDTNALSATIKYDGADS